MANKITGLEIFDDGEGKMDLSLLDLMDKILKWECSLSHSLHMETVERQKTVVYKRKSLKENYLHKYFGICVKTKFM